MPLFYNGIPSNLLDVKMPLHAAGLAAMVVFVLNLILRRNVWQITAQIVLLTADMDPLSVDNGILVTTGIMTSTVSSAYVMMAGSARSQGMKTKILMKN